MCLGAFALSLFGCSQGDVAEPAPGCLDISALPSTPAISFRNDLMPIFGLGCIASSCHDQGAHKANLVLGDPSACGPMGTNCFDATAKWSYTFKTAPADREALATSILANLVNAASATNPALVRVVPQNPANSFLLDKVTGQQNSKQYPGTCTNLDTTRPGVCGSDMPQGTPGGLCAEQANRVTAIAQWIQQGAQNN